MGGKGNYVSVVCVTFGFVHVVFGEVAKMHLFVFIFKEDLFVVLHILISFILLIFILMILLLLPFKLAIHIDILGITNQVLLILILIDLFLFRNIK